MKLHPSFITDLDTIGKLDNLWIVSSTPMFYDSACTLPIDNPCSMEVINLSDIRFIDRPTITIKDSTGSELYVTQPIMVDDTFGSSPAPSAPVDTNTNVLYAKYLRINKEWQDGQVARIGGNMCVDNTTYTQDISVGNSASITGALSGSTATFTGNVTAPRFVGKADAVFANESSTANNDYFLTFLGTPANGDLFYSATNGIRLNPSNGNVKVIGALSEGGVLLSAKYAPISHTQLASTITDFATAADARITAQKGVALGLVPLDSGAKISTTYLPASILGQVHYNGVWNATTNTPTLPTASTDKGGYYIVSVAGTYNSTDYQIGDWVISDGTNWSKVDNTDSISSWNGRTGAITPLKADYGSWFVDLSGAYVNPSWISSLAWSKLTGTPTTLAGYGITSADSLFASINAGTATKLQTARTIAGVSFDGSANISIPYANLTGLPTLGSLAAKSTITWTSDITGVPTGLSQISQPSAHGNIKLGSTIVGGWHGIEFSDSDVTRLLVSGGAGSDFGIYDNGGWRVKWTRGGALVTGSVPWSLLTGVPSTFTPSAHTHSSLTNTGIAPLSSAAPSVWAIPGLDVRRSTNTGAYPYAYGNILSLAGDGVAQIQIGMNTGASPSNTSMYFRNSRDVVDSFSTWARVLDTASDASSITNWNSAYSWGNHASAGYSLNTHTHTFASLTSKPTTLSGYGITDAATSSHNHDSTYLKLSGGTLADNTGIGSYGAGTGGFVTQYKNVSFPNDLETAGLVSGSLIWGYNGTMLATARYIGNATAGDVVFTNNAGGFSFSSLNVTGAITENGVAISSKYSTSAHTHTFASLTSKPFSTTDVTNWQNGLDRISSLETRMTGVDNNWGNYSLATHTHTFASLTSKPTTLSGYGITDALNTTNGVVGTTIVNASAFTSSFVQDIFETTTQGYCLRELRTQETAPASLLGNYSSGIAWRGEDTYGSLMVAYNGPQIRVAGGNGTNPTWAVDLYHTGNFNPSSYLPLTGGTITGPIKGSSRAGDGGCSVYAPGSSTLYGVNNGTNTALINRYSYSAFTGFSTSNTEFYGMTNDHGAGTGSELSLISGYVSGSIGFYAGTPTVQANNYYAAPKVGTWTNSGLTVTGFLNASSYVIGASAAMANWAINGAYAWFGKNGQNGSTWATANGMGVGATETWIASSGNIRMCSTNNTDALWITGTELYSKNSIFSFGSFVGSVVAPSDSLGSASRLGVLSSNKQNGWCISYGANGDMQLWDSTANNWTMRYRFTALATKLPIYAVAGSAGLTIAQPLYDGEVRLYKGATGQGACYLKCRATTEIVCYRSDAGARSVIATAATNIPLDIQGQMVMLVWSLNGASDGKWTMLV